MNQEPLAEEATEDLEARRGELFKRPSVNSCFQKVIVNVVFRGAW
jgi:hypothetical protein